MAANYGSIDPRTQQRLLDVELIDELPAQLRPAGTERIAAGDRCRRQIELFFRWSNACWAAGACGAKTEPA